MLAVDVSGSIDEVEARFQREGYVAALRHPEVVQAIQSGMFGRIAVTYFEWADDDYQRPVPTGRDRGYGGIHGFADALAETPLPGPLDLAERRDRLLDAAVRRQRP